MYGTELYVAVVVGAILSLVYTEITGIIPGGLVVPGYIALVFTQPYLVLMVMIISFLTYFAVNFGLSRIIILYGRRKFVAMLTVAIIIKVAMEYIFPYLPYEIFEITGVGVIVPGIIANTIQRQGFAHTALSTVLISGITYVTLAGYSWLLL